MTALVNPIGPRANGVYLRNKVRLIDPNNGRLLHMSGKGTVSGLDWAWMGARHQAELLADRAKRRGEHWPFVMVHRETLDHILAVEVPDLISAGEAAFHLFAEVRA